MRPARSAPLLAAALLCACATAPTFTTGYTPPPAGQGGALERSVAVVPFEDQRPERVYDDTARLFFVYVPLLPWVSLDYERFDESVQLLSSEIERTGHGITAASKTYAAPPFDAYAYPRSFARAVAEDLRASGLFREVAFVDDGSTESFDYVLRGTLRESPMEQSTSSYCLGVMGVLFWLLPIPNQKTDASVALDLRLEDRAGNVVWSGPLEGDVWRFTTLYHTTIVYGRKGALGLNMMSPPGSAGVDRSSLFSWHFEALRRAMNETRPQLEQAVRGSAAAR